MKQETPKKAGVLQRPSVMAARPATPSPKPAATQAAAPAESAIPTRVVATITAFVAAVAVVPLAAYALSMRYVYPGDALRAAIIAVVAVNAVLFLYVLVAFSGIVDGPSGPRPKTD